MEHTKLFFYLFVTSFWKALEALFQTEKQTQ